MAPDDDDVQVMVDALLTVNAAVEQTTRQSTRAGRREMLRVIADHPGIRPSELAEHLDVHASHVARQVRDCEAAGFVTVAPDRVDRRSSVITLEPAGSDELHRLAELTRDRFAVFLEDWKPDEVRTLAELLAKLRTSMDTVFASERRARRRRLARNDGQPDWLIDFLHH
jgi:DNA-binding MarR family transcriptional regulator